MIKKSSQENYLKITKNIPAFTISEMIVVLILTSIVIGLAFTVLSLVQKQMLGIQSNFQTSTELRLLEQSLWLDFNRYTNIEYDDLEHTLTLKTEIDSVSYKFLEKSIVKELDTFMIPLKSKTFFFDGNTVNNGKIDAIKMETLKEFQEKLMFVFKKNDANAFMN